MDRDGISQTTTTRSLISTSRRPRSRLQRMDAADHFQQQDPGDASGEAIPVPIPNTEVKLSSAEDTERAAFRENRSSPGFLRFRGWFPGGDPEGRRRGLGGDRYPSWA